jgi:MYXO-CTERM domain-containing protein
MFASALRRGPALAAALATVATTTTAFAATYNYVNWNTADVSGGTASGTIPLQGDAGVTVTFAATTADGGAGDLYGAQTGGNGANYWLPAGTYESAAVENAPPTSDILQLAGGENETYTVNLSEPIVDPIMAIVSLGAAGAPITYNFDSPFTIVSQGTDQWGGTSTSLVQQPNNVLQGEEGSGVIQFIGTYSKFSWTVPTPEQWHGFTFGILTSAALYDGGGPDGSTVVIADDGGVVSSSDGGIDDASTAPPDAGSSSEAGLDAGSTADATVPDAGSLPPTAGDDSGVAAGDDASVDDAGAGSNPATPTSASSSCGCKAAGSGGSWGLASLVALLGAVGLLRRRRS